MDNPVSLIASSRDQSGRSWCGELGVVSWVKVEESAPMQCSSLLSIYSPALPPSLTIFTSLLLHDNLSTDKNEETEPQQWQPSAPTTRLDRHPMRRRDMPRILRNTQPRFTTVMLLMMRNTVFTVA